jgi:hypothetical protein
MSLTKNALTEFDLCVAVSQVAIDSQMTSAWNTWKRRTKTDKTITLYKRIRNGQLVDSTMGLSAVIAPLQVSLAVEDSKLSQVKVTLSLTSGLVKYFDEDIEGTAEHTFKDWRISFLTDLERNPVSLEDLKALDPEAHATATDIVKSSGLPEAVFSIEYLFLKLTRVDLMLSDNKNIDIPADTPSEARTKALEMLNLLFQGKMGTYLLGTVVRRNRTQATPTFALTDFVFNTRANWDDGKASTLEYLGMLGGRSMPADPDAARLNLKDIWVQPERINGRVASVAGAMVLSKAIVLEKFILPELTKAFGYEPQVTEEGWRYFVGVNRREPQEVFGGRQEHTLVTTSTLVVKPEVGTNRILLEGGVGVKVLYDGFNFVDPNNPIEWLYVEGQQTLNGAIALTGSGIGASFQLELALTHSFQDYEETKHEVSPLMTFYDGISTIAKIWGGQTIQEVMTFETVAYTTAMKEKLDSALSGLALDMQQHAFIPPGGGVFTMKEPRFTPAHDLMLDLLYIAP